MIFAAAAPMCKIRLAFIRILSPSGRVSDSYLVCCWLDLGGQPNAERLSRAAALPGGEEPRAEDGNAGFI
jgi:hypothetical protein